MEAQKYVWKGGIPLQIQLHESEVTTLPPPPPAFVLAPRIGYLPLLLPLIKPHFASTLPPGVDTVWFDYKGLPLKWYIPTGVLFDLLCAEPERPWNITVHFRGYPSNLLIPCEDEDSVKWNFINSLKEADYIVNGNCKNVMHMPQSDQVELWHSVMNGNLDAYLRASFKLKLGPLEDEYASRMDLCSPKSRKPTSDSDVAGQVKTELRVYTQRGIHQKNKDLPTTLAQDQSLSPSDDPPTTPGKIPVRLYIWTLSDDFEDWEDVPQIDSWDKILYINRPLEFHRDEGKYLTLYDALKTMLPEFFAAKCSTNEESCSIGEDDEQKVLSEDSSNRRKAEDGIESSSQPNESYCTSGGVAEIKLVRIQGIEPKLEIPFSWVANNLKNPEHFLHICVLVKVPF